MKSKVLKDILELRDILRKQRCTVLFRKADGSEREMICTLDFSQIPNGDELKKKEYSKEEEDKKLLASKILTVFDLEKNAWRKIPYDRLVWAKTKDTSYVPDNIGRV